jgi:signal transduction histidine kinase/CheY-like chemotaxis protein
MKKFYIIFLALPLLFFTLLYLSIWWFIGCVVVIMAVIAYRFYAVHLQASEARKEVLEMEVEDLNVRLENAVLKEQKTGKEAEQVKQVKQQLLSVLSHEIRTPMNGVLGMSLLLEDTTLTKEQQECINTIRGCAESLLTTINNLLVNDILDFSKLQQEGNKLEYKNFDLRDSIEEVLELFAGKAGEAGLDLLYEIDENVPAQIIGDSKRLRQVLMNLVENAVKFTSHGEIFVGIHQTISTTTGYPPELNFEIRDTGTGMAKDQLKHLFKGIPGKEFKNESETETAGLGLVICKKLVELMGGTIGVKSQQGQGSSFIFSIPITPSMKSTRDHAQQNNMINLEGKNILIVDDNATNRTILMKQMKSWKMLPVSADSGKQALEILAKKTFDLVLTDITMPEMDGIQLAKSIREKYPAIPVIGMNYPGDERYKQETGIFSAVITKPMRQHILRDHILGALSVKSADKKDNANPLSDDFAKQYPLRILIAEDNLINQKIATKILTKLGYQPELANHGKEVMEKVSTEHYDIILMDVQMPEMNGLEATRMIRTCLEIQPIIIAMTANVMQGDRDDCIQAGMDDYMSKPIVLPELLSQLEKWALVLRERRNVSTV